MAAQRYVGLKSGLAKVPVDLVRYERTISLMVLLGG